MSFTITTAINQHTADFDGGSEARARGYFTEGTWSTRNTKSNGSLPLSTGNATAFINTTTTGTQGSYWEFDATATYDVTTDTRVLCFLFQFNAPNRLEIDTVANNGLMLRIGSGGTPPAAPTAYKTFQIGGQDTAMGKERQFPNHIIIDLNADSEEAEINTLDLTAVECYGFGSKTLNMGGSTTQLFLQRAFLFETTKGATNIPRFIGTSDWDDIITAMGTAYNTKITHGWLAREGTIFSVACPIEIGDGSTTTNFNDNGVSVFWPDDDEPSNPRVRVTEQAFRFYLNLPNHTTNGTATFTGNYDCGNSYPLWDFDQDDSAVVTLSNANFKRTGTFLVGSSITGNATFDDCGVITFQDNGVDLDGSTFKNPHALHLIKLVP